MEVANLYDNGPISPVCQIDEKLGIWTENTWRYFNTEFIEGIPRSRPMAIDIVALNNAANIAANGVLTAQFVLAIQPQGTAQKTNELLHLRWEPLDDVEGQLYELAPARYAPRGAQATVTQLTSMRDPYLATTTFFVLGPNKDAKIGAYNPNGVALPRATFVFWGFRYILNPLSTVPAVCRKIPAQAFAF